jgi:hypothetical protein
MVEVKGGARPVEDSARAAVSDLLAYRRAFASVLTKKDYPYGLGIAWGAELHPSIESEVVLTTPDNMAAALQGCGL